jgi:hypothetical protein
MKPQFNNKVLASVFLWAENRISNDLQGYINHTSQLYYQADDAIGSGYVAYAAPFKQWVYDSGVAGATIIDKISGDFGVLTRGQSGLKFDFDNGRVILDAAVGTNLDITGSYAFKEVNTYLTNESQDAVITSDEYYLNPRFQGEPTGALPPYVKTTPAVFISLMNSKNEPWALGGTDMGTSYMSMTVLAETPYQMNALLGSFTDAYHQYIPITEVTDDPINEWGDLKVSGYNYNDVKSLRGTPGNIMRISNVATSQISDGSIRRGGLNQALYMGFIDVDVQFPRNTNQN